MSSGLISSCGTDYEVHDAKMTLADMLSLAIYKTKEMLCFGEFDPDKKENFEFYLKRLERYKKRMSSPKRPRPTPRYLLAQGYAKGAHMGQVRKYTGEPYFEHCQAVADIVASVTDDEDTLIAALLHDVVEDTGRTNLDIHNTFGPRVAQYVEEVTDISKPEDGNRTFRKLMDCYHLSNASAEGKTIKLADLIHNTSSIVEHDPKFAKVYLAEKEELLRILAGGNRELWIKAYMQLRRSQAQLNIPIETAA